MCVCVQIEEVQRGVVEKERNHHRLVEQERALEHSFAEAIGENNKFKDFLLKVCVNYMHALSLHYCGCLGVSQEDKASQAQGG